MISTPTLLADCIIDVITQPFFVHGMSGGYGNGPSGGKRRGSTALRPSTSTNAFTDAEASEFARPTWLMRSPPNRPFCSVAAGGTAAGRADGPMKSVQPSGVPLKSTAAYVPPFLPTVHLPPLPTSS